MLNTGSYSSCKIAEKYCSKQRDYEENGRGLGELVKQLWP